MSGGGAPLVVGICNMATLLLIHGLILASSSLVVSVAGAPPYNVHSLDQLHDIIASNELVVVDFKAEWSGPCTLMTPYYIQLSEYTPNVVFLFVDVDEVPEAAAQYGVNALPTFILIKSGSTVESVMGANKGELAKKVRQFAAGGLIAAD